MLGRNMHAQAALAKMYTRDTARVSWLARALAASLILAS
jgi:hypothetical protein